ncbi:MAG: hypothetical protein LPD71_02325 [Shewanella sp.]|nr:hypothetical protein [Shewanella sp.]MCF1429536.1 hypothetical protein [Shewanella sp.]MCF1437612.1 hypothetical protein [Shewanella sp.]MCF1457720.1 hypothetical protein [Shewanella sp.]
MLTLKKFLRTPIMVAWLMICYLLTLVSLVLALPKTLVMGLTLQNLRMAVTGCYLQYLDANEYVSTGKYGNRLITAFKGLRK